MALPIPVKELERLSPQEKIKRLEKLREQILAKSKEEQEKHKEHIKEAERLIHEILEAEFEAEEVETAASPKEEETPKEEEKLEEIIAKTSPQRGPEPKAVQERTYTTPTARSEREERTYVNPNPRTQENQEDRIPERRYEPLHEHKEEFDILKREYNEAIRDKKYKK